MIDSFKRKKWGNFSTQELSGRKSTKTTELYTHVCNKVSGRIKSLLET